MNYNKLYIDGKWQMPDSDELIQVENPANKEIIGSVVAANEADVNKAVAAAKKALPTWRKLPLEKRIEYVDKLLLQLRNREEDMVETIVKELGAPKDFARNTHFISYLEEIEDLIDLVKDYQFKEEHEGFTVVKEAVGVVGALTPWNYPFGQIAKKLAPALLSGSTIVLKPSQKTPLVAHILAEVIDEIDLPAGVFNLVSGRGSDVGNPLAKHPDVNLISFTGSTKGGREVGKLAVADVKRMVLELGGKSPAILLKDADYKLAIKTVLDDIYYNTGQSCSALSRLLVHKDDKEKVEKMIIDMTKDYTFGDPQTNVMVGPLSSKQQFDKVKKYIELGKKEAKLLLGEVPQESEGYYVNPVVFTDVDNTSTIAQDEIFGPVLCIITYEDEEDAIRIANETKYGLSSAVFGEKKKALQLADKIKAGEVYINGASARNNTAFGGYKHSGFGREGGKYGFEEYLEIKTIYK